MRLNNRTWQGGLGGKALKHIALGNVTMLREMVAKYNENMMIIGVGGIFCGQDVIDMLACDANAVQIATCHFLEGPSCFARIEKEYLDILGKTKSCL